jgi:DDE family transposase
VEIMVYSNGSRCNFNGRIAHKFTGTLTGCGPCTLRSQCLRHPERTPVRQVAMFTTGQPSAHAATQLMQQAIDSDRGRRIYSQRIATVELVFATVHAARARKCGHAVADVLPGAQHREARAQRLSMKSVIRRDFLRRPTNQ